MQHGGNTLWQPGQVITRREFLHGQLWTARPEYVVEDTGDRFITFLQTGNELAYPEAPGLEPHPWQGRFERWMGHGKLCVLWPEHGWTVSIFWTGPERRFDCWYVDIVEAPRRWAGGFDTLDQELDLVIGEDGIIHDKDVELFAEEVAAGRFSEAEAIEIRAKFASVRHMIERDGIPVESSWKDWTPPASWGAARIPARDDPYA